MLSVNIFYKLCTIISRYLLFVKTKPDKTIK